MTIPVEITDSRLVRAYAHPLRGRILTLLDNRTASPSEIAAEIGSPLSNTAYHVRQLVSLGLVELVSRTARRGAIEHHYTAKVRPTITDEGWAALPNIVKRSVMDGWLRHTLLEVLSAGEAGAFDREDSHHTRTAGRLDQEGWSTLAGEMTRMLKRAEQIVEESEQRLAADPHAKGVETTVVLLQFETPAPKAVGKRKPARRSRTGEPELQLDDAPPSG